ncbi:hypothetical protein HYG86_11355 [Alkalicella caledoniensis]|uniref:Uncharacterized protein n=1 Tax=Alkalicella caledoniensis TaxID=2731377 RepID=A0A7G9W9F7_ALKCA|nr:hypothetical protein [Alkalicella caledoniensis]QNO15319.1 hypothetical protein HYG86_11355 [Alkalicella caledoniensis]
MDELKLMTGEEFLNKVRGIKTITDIQWHIEGEDWFDPEFVQIIVIADGEKIEITYPRPNDYFYDEFRQFCAIALIINKFMEQIGKDFRTNHANNLAQAINYSRQEIKNLK